MPKLSDYRIVGGREVTLVGRVAVITKAGIGRKALRVIVGNPLIAIATYIKSSSLMVVESNPELLSAPEVLDAKLAALASNATND